MSQKLKHLIKEYGTQALIIIAGISLILLVNNAAVTPSHALDNAQAPVFTLAALSGEEIALSNKLGEGVIVLDFFATWCPPCVRGLPVIDSLSKEFEAQGVQFYAVNVMEDKDAVQSFIKSKGLELEVLLDQSGEVSDLYHVQGIPQTVIIGKDGKVHTVHVGVTSGFEEELRADIKSALNPQ